ncbi:stathmin-like isoform X3 [Biomphalaria glabrata]|uniref:Stathmin-like isoform X3 n=1 Tax=Biomphalaria glabrata TaxID=6526 RepID=A0A2C9KBP3_BIOGL|nr:stathmin-like isoform X3 [Biomphalaria glabrata]
MSTVCSWFSILCLRETQKKKTVQHRIHPNRQAYDAIVVWKGKENQKAKQGGISFDVILKPASVESPKAPVQLSPRDVKKRELSQEQLENKLKKAEERRSLIEQERMEQLAKERQKAIEVVTKAQSENEQFSKKTQEKLRRSMEIRRENRETQIRALQERLREHANHINEVCQASENRGPSTDDLQEQLVQKMENALKNREEQLRNLQERLAEHENRIKEVQRKKLISESETEK